MPGEIGASIFSPRPARGYRFHSLQVEIIYASIAASNAVTIGSIKQSSNGRAQHLCCDLNALLKNRPRVKPFDDTAD
jgi:hypothetical protein